MDAGLVEILSCFRDVGVARDRSAQPGTDRRLTLCRVVRPLSEEVWLMKKLTLLVCAFGLVLAADTTRYREDFHYSYPQTGGGRISLENFNGSVEITGWDQNTVDVSGTKYAESRDLLNAVQIEVS